MRWPLSRKEKDPRAYLMETVADFYWDGFEPPSDDIRGRLALEELARRIQRLLDSGQAAVQAWNQQAGAHDCPAPAPGIDRPMKKN